MNINDLAAAKKAADIAYQASVGGARLANQPSTWWTTQSAMTMCAAVLTFGILVLGLAAWLMKSGRSGTSILRIFGTILIIIMTTFLVVAGYNNAQLTAPIGLLGTLAGYLLGKETTPEQEQRGNPTTKVGSTETADQTNTSQSPQAGSESGQPKTQGTADKADAATAPQAAASNDADGGIVARMQSEPPGN